MAPSSTSPATESLRARVGRVGSRQIALMHREMQDFSIEQQHLRDELRQVEGRLGRIKLIAFLYCGHFYNSLGGKSVSFPC